MESRPGCPSKESDNLMIIRALFWFSAIVTASGIGSSPHEQAQLALYERQLIAAIPKRVPTRAMPSTPFPPASGLPEAIIYEAHRAIFCSIQPRDARVSACRDGFEWFGEGRQICGILTDSFAVIAFKPIDMPARSNAVSLRLRMHQQMHNLATFLLKLIQKLLRKERQIILVGAQSGAGLAEWACWYLIHNFCPHQPIKNALNQFKVIGWDELPMLSHDNSLRSPVLSRNHLCFLQEARQVVDEEASFASNSMKVTLEANAVRKHSASNPELGLLLAFTNAPFRSTALKAPADCATAVSAELGAAFADESIRCRVSQYEVDKGSFEVHCSHSGIQFLSFEAQLNFGEEGVLAIKKKPEKKVKSKKQKHKSKKKKHRHSSTSSDSDSSSSSSSSSKKKPSVTRVSGWEACLHQLLTGQEHARLLIPFTIDDRDAQVRNWHHLDLPALSTQFWQNEPVTGCQVRPLNVAHELFQLTASDLAYFYRAVRVDSMIFPVRYCIGQLVHVSLPDSAQANQYAQMATTYLAERLESNIILTRDAPVSLFRSRNTRSFETIEVHGKDKPNILL